MFFGEQKEKKGATEAARKNAWSEKSGVGARALTFTLVSQRKFQVSMTV
jgi:hypothetical protein